MDDGTRTAADDPRILADSHACVASATSTESTLYDAATYDEVLAFQITEGHVENHFYRCGPVAAHLLASSGSHPRILVAFPAGNTGVGLWFDPPAEPVELRVEGGLEGLTRPCGLRGVRAVLRASTARLRACRALLGSIRVLRDHGHQGGAPVEFAHEVHAGISVVLRRRTLDGRHRIQLEIEPLGGTLVHVEHDGALVLAAPPGAGGVRARLTALVDNEPLTPIAARELLVEGVSARAHDLRALAFLSYREKLLAGSWRFLTYFGRDTLLSVRLLMPVLRPEVTEAGLGSVLARLDPDGYVAHEEDIGEYAALHHLRSGRTPPDPCAPLFDYHMVDDDFLLAPVFAHYVLDTPAGRARAQAFLAARTPSGVTRAEALRCNLDLVLRLAEPFATAPSAATLVALREGRRVGQWRDSYEGLGYGRVPYDVNAALVPAALRAAARLFESPLLGCDRDAARRARSFERAWERARALFDVRVGQAEAAARLETYAREHGLDAAEALASLDGPVEFSALALDAQGSPLPVMHSDDGFALLFTDPSPASLERTARSILAPFPAGLRTPVGVLVANPAYASDAALRATFTRGHYHGTVVWSWQQALLAAGLRRQLQRSDLPARTRARLGEAEAALWTVIHATDAMRSTELWSFEVEDGRYKMVPYGQSCAHADESNAVQLWSTVYLAVRPPDGLARG